MPLERQVKKYRQRFGVDNNIAENHVRPIAIGRKNCLFATSTKGAIGTV